LQSSRAARPYAMTPIERVVFGVLSLALYLALAFGALVFGSYRYEQSGVQYLALTPIAACLAVLGALLLWPARRVGAGAMHALLPFVAAAVCAVLPEVSLADHVLELGRWLIIVIGVMHFVLGVLPFWKLDRRALLVLLSAPLVGSADAQSARKHSYVPPKGFVPDSVTAVRVAEAIWTPIYGEEQLRRQRPFRASLRQGVWHVAGTLPPGAVGGVAVAEISKRDARILRVSHGR